MNESIEYKNHKIQIINDLSAQNPYEDFDGLPRLMVNYEGSFIKYGTFDVDDILTLEKEQVKTHLTTVKNILNDQRPLLTILRTETYLDRFDNALEPFNEYLQEFYGGLTKKDKLVMLSEFLTIKNIPHLLTKSRGHSQGDYVELLLVSDEEEYTQENFQGAADLYSAWAWGDVYGYAISTEEEEIDSCFGFYGCDHEKSGLMEYAKNAIDCQIHSQRVKKLKAIKTLIKNRVPLNTRAAILSNFGR